jgi:iron complex transport system substrate-binding protein
MLAGEIILTSRRVPVSPRFRLASLAGLLILVASLVACQQAAAPTPAATSKPAATVAAAATPAPAASAAPSTAYPLTLTDDAGRSVKLDKAPQRIISLSSSNTELIYALGMQDRLVGVDDFSDYPAEAKSKEKIGGFSKPNFEKIVSLQPDLLLATNLHVKSVVPELENRGLKVIVFQPQKLDNVMDNLRTLGKAVGGSEAAEKVAAGMKSRIDAVVEKVKSAKSRPRVFMELDPDLITVGPNTFIDDMITKAGGENIARDADTAWPKMSPEAIVSKNPQIIVLSDMGSDAGGVTIEMVKARPGWNVVDAVKNNRIVELPDRDLTDRPGPRAVEGLEFLARTLQPELFK